MTDIALPLFNPRQVDLTETVLYQVPANTKTIIKYLSITNTSTVPISVTINTPTSNEISDITNQFCIRRVAGQDTLKIFEATDLTLASGSSLRATADAHGAIIRAAGIEIV